MVGEAVIDPRTARPDLAPELAAFLLKACAPYRSERLSTAWAMKAALAAIRNGGR